MFAQHIGFDIDGSSMLEESVTTVVPLVVESSYQECSQAPECPTLVLLDHFS